MYSSTLSVPTGYPCRYLFVNNPTVYDVMDEAPGRSRRDRGASHTIRYTLRYQPMYRYPRFPQPVFRFPHYISMHLFWNQHLIKVPS